MSDKVTAEFIAAELQRTSKAQASAADPTASVWVSANAGTGKTHVLTTRVLRLMLAGTPPERILCLTYTKAAAAEMSKRVFDSLAKWVMLPEDALRAALAKDYLGRAPSTEELNLARTLFTRATETPGGLRVQTIHAFAERLLQRFPLEAGVTPASPFSTMTPRARCGARPSTRFSRALFATRRARLPQHSTQPSRTRLAINSTIS